MAFGVSSNHPAFYNASGFGAFGRSTPAFGTCSAFGTASSSPAFGRSTSGFVGSSMFEQNPASERSGFTTPSSPFGNPSQELQPTMGVFGTPPLEASSKPAFGVPSTPASASSVTPAFGDSSTPASGSNSTPAFGSTGSAFGVSNSPFGSTTPAFGTSPTSSYGPTGFSFSSASATASDHSPTPFGVTSIPASPFCSIPSRAQSSPFGAHATTLAFGDHSSSQFNQPPVGSRVYSYAQTPEAVDWRSGTQPSNLESISAMPFYKGKTHEELRWEDYQSGDKGGPNPAGQSSGGTEFKTNNMRSNLFSTPFGPATSPFSSTRSTNPFAQTTFSTPGFVSSSHTLNSSPFGPPTSAPAQLQTPSPYPFGTPTSPSPFGTPDTSNRFGPAQAQTPSVFYTTASNPFGTPTSHSLFGTPNTSGFGTPSSIPATTQAQGTTSSFANGINPGTQSANLFQSSSPALGQPTSPFGQPLGPPWVQAAPYYVQNAPVTPFLSSPFQSAQATQNPTCFVAQTGGIGGFNQNRFEQMFTHLFGALQAMRQMSATVAGEPAPMRLSCVSSNDISFMMLEFQNLKL